MNIIRSASLRDRALIALTFGACLLGIGVRLHGLDYPLWLDEIASVAFAEQPLSLLWSDWMARETNPPLFYAVLKGWIALFGSGDAVLRLLPALFGIVTIGAAAWLARHLSGGDGRAALVAALFVALSPSHIVFGQQVRGFTLSALAALFACIAVIRIVEADRAARPAGGSGGDWFAFVGALLVALYSHTTMLVFYLAINLVLGCWMVMPRASKPLRIRWVLCNLLVAAGYAWWILVTLRQMGSTKNLDWMPAFTLRDGGEIIRLLLAPQSWDWWPWCAVLAITPLALAGLCERWGRAAAALLGAGIAIAFALSVLGGRALVHERTMLWLIPVFAVLVGLGATRLRPLIAVPLVAATLVMAGVALRQQFPLRIWDRWPEIVAEAERSPQLPLIGRDELILSVQYYCRKRHGDICPVRLLPIRTRDTADWMKGMSGLPPATPSDIARLGGARFMTIDWDESQHYELAQARCGRDRPGPAYRRIGYLVAGQPALSTWQRLPGCVKPVLNPDID